MTLEEKTPPRKSVDSHVRDFCNYTTTHGFGRLTAARDRGVSWHMFWIFMLIGAHSLFYYHTYMIITDYLARPIRTKVTMRHGKVSDKLFQNKLIPNLSRQYGLVFFYMFDRERADNINKPQ